MILPRKVKDIRGQRFGRFVVLEYVGTFYNGISKWKCQCDCGGIGIKTKQTLITKPYCIECKPSWQYHGKANSQVYQAWLNMKARCYNKKHNSYPNYGGRGIYVNKFWKSTFITFYDYMGDPPTPNHSLDRIDNNGNYEPGNCRWATKTEQETNKQRK